MTGALKYEEYLGSSSSIVDLALARLEGAKVMERLWRRDHEVWKPSPEGIANRLGWLDLPRQGPAELSPLVELARQVRAAGLDRAVLIGMGGSSLAPELFRKTFGVADGWLDLRVADTTDPDAVVALTGDCPPERTLYVAATKSGGTVETLSLLKHFWARACEALGAAAGGHFVAITDPGSRLAALAEQHGFRATVLGIPEVGGRFSALSPFGLFPAALLGLDVERLIASACDMAERCGPSVLASDNPAARLGVTMAELARAGRDKLTLTVDDPGLGDSFCDWVEQLVAESTGKEGAGILPVVGEPFARPARYGSDRLFVCMGRAAEAEGARARRESLVAAGHAMVCLRFDDPYDLGGLIFVWELATAVAGHCLQVNPFDQPDVEAAKVAGRRAVAEFRERGALPAETPAVDDGALAVYGDVTADTPAGALHAFFDRARPPEYVGIQAYLPPDAEIAEALAELRWRLHAALGIAVTVGYGPRFLHSTGQLHKGDAGRGRFLQLTADPAHDVPIPDEMGDRAGALSFGVLEAAQALGDRHALVAAGRKVLRVHLGHDPVAGLMAVANFWDAPRISTIPGPR
jgi:glucose-6-phosphate isomerase